jgi:serine/threonine protein kinase
VFLPETLPWIFSAYTPATDDLPTLSYGVLELIKAVQHRRHLCRHMAEQARGWRASALLHNDLKSDNVLVSPSGTSVRVCLIDWELATWGDPAWDVASVLAELIDRWVSVSTIRPTDTEWNTRAFLDVRRSSVPFWTSYAARRQLAAHDRTALWMRALGLLPCKLLMNAFAYSYTQSAPTMRAVRLMQLAENLIVHPVVTRRQIFGLAEAYSSAE